METRLFSFSVALFILNCLTLSSTKIILNHSTEKQSLVSFKSSIVSDPNSMLINNWSANTSICEWAGVSCGPTHQRVTALNVSGFALRGNLPPHLGNLTFLRSLDISSNFSLLKTLNLEGNRLTGSIPYGIFNISSMVDINFGNNSLYGELPNDICSNANPKLKRLVLGRNLLFGRIPPNIGNCRELEQLWLIGNNFSGSIPSEIGKLNMLTALSLSFNRLTGPMPKEVGNLTSLKFRKKKREISCRIFAW